MYLVPCGKVGMQVHVRANRPDWGRVGSVRRAGLEQAGPGRVRVGYGQVRVGCGQVRVRSALARLGRPESCGARLGRADSEVCRFRVRLKAQVSVSVSGMSEAWLRAGPGLLMRACEIKPGWRVG